VRVAPHEPHRARRGRTPHRDPSEPFDQIVRAYLAAPRQRRRTGGTRLRAALYLGRAAVTRLPEIPTALPDLPKAAPATESAGWRGSHL
jgi:hypothetical protein